MTVAEEAVTLDRTGVGRVEAGVGWNGALRLTVDPGGQVAFGCTATRRPTGTWFVTDCLPLRRGPDGAALLLGVCDYLFAEQRASDLIVVHPEFWDSWLQAAGATPLQRMLAMRLDLDRELLTMHERVLPGRYRIKRLAASTAGLAPLIETDGDRQVWLDTFEGHYGRPIPEATVAVFADADVRSAVAVTEYEGTPFLAQCVTSPEERGKGLGRAALLAGLTNLADAGYVDCRLNVEAENWLARRMYRSVGFIQTGPALRVSHLGKKSR